jgi:hypothetical protein
LVGILTSGFIVENVPENFTFAGFGNILPEALVLMIVLKNEPVLINLAVP